MYKLGLISSESVDQFPSQAGIEGWAHYIDRTEFTFLYIPVVTTRSQVGIVIDDKDVVVRSTRGVSKEMVNLSVGHVVQDVLDQRRRGDAGGGDGRRRAPRGAPRRRLARGRARRAARGDDESVERAVAPRRGPERQGGRRGDEAVVDEPGEAPEGAGGREALGVARAHED